VRRGDDADVDLDRLGAADRRERALLQDPQSLTCSAADISPISSRKKVPPSATWNSPG
jgi:hypothetical protein